VALRYIFLVIILLVPALAEAQLSAPGMRTVRYTSYPSSPAVRDPVFIYCNDTGSQKGTLVASSPKGTGPFNFSWYQWSDITKNFTILLKTESGVITSTADNLGEGGYNVVISGGYDTSLVGWIFIDRPYSSAKLQNRTCDYVALNGEAAVDTFYYRNPVNGIPLKLPNGISFLWSSDPQSTIPRPDFLIDPQILGGHLDFRQLGGTFLERIMGARLPDLIGEIIVDRPAGGHQELVKIRSQGPLDQGIVAGEFFQGSLGPQLGHPAWRRICARHPGDPARSLCGQHAGARCAYALGTSADPHQSGIDGAPVQ